MKKFFIAKYSVLASLLVTATVLSGCRNEFDFERAHDGDSFADKKVEYKEAFETAFCDGVEINPTHTWGFEELQSEEALMQSVMTRAIDVNRNMWDGQFVVPNAITDDERQAVYEYFKANSSTMSSETFDYSDFFVQQVYRGTDSYTANNGGTVVGSNQMNQLMAGAEHVNDFNSGDGSITRVYNGTSSSFSYHNSTDSQYHSEYKILFVPNYGWYLGFDFCATGQNPNQQVAADGVYTDWILKVTPAIPVTTKRVMCEDLGTIGDFDYNDAVFDVLYVTNTKARIILRCAGATLDIYIGKMDPEYEVHNLFGVSKGTMVNTSRAGLEGNVTSGVVYRPPVVFELDGLTSTNPIDIPIYVGDSESNYALTAAQGEAPHKICVPMSVEWTNERLPINVQYKKFAQWVNNPEILFWEGENVWTGEATPDLEHSGLTPAEIEGNNLAAAVAAALSAIETAASGDDSYNVQKAAQDAKNAINHAETVAAVDAAKNAGLLAIQAAKDANKAQQEATAPSDYGTAIAVTNSDMDGLKFSEIASLNSYFHGNGSSVTLTCVVTGWLNGDLKLYYWDTVSNPYYHHWSVFKDMTKISNGVYKLEMTWDEYHNDIVKANLKVAFGANCENYPVVYLK